MRRPLPAGNVPMCSETHRRLALELRMSIETLIDQPSPAAYNQVSKMLAALGRAGLAGAALDLANDTMSDICDRYVRVGKVGASDVEAEQLRLAAGGIDRKLPFIPLNRVREAVAEVELFCAEAGA